MVNTINDMCEFLILYFQSRNCHNWGYTGYKQFRALIMYITDMRDIGEIRTIFETMIKSGWFKKRKIRGKTDYLFLYDYKN